MSRPRFFLTEPWAGGPLPLGDGDLRHLLSALRATQGDEIVTVTTEGRALVVELTDVATHGVAGRVVGELDGGWTPQVVLVQAMAKNSRMDTVIEKATEVGVSAVVPLAAERSVTRLSASKARDRTARWQRIAEAAAKQSGRTVVPRVWEPREVGDVAAALEGVAHILICDETEPGLRGIGETLTAVDASSHDRVAVVVGPEGGLTPGEVSVLEELGAVRVTLGATVLRTETAGMIAVALVAYELGGLGGRARD